ncbi:MAG: 50S ribosomal protein L29 [Gammaproteobacteria bacterium]|nr:50S ribosomal protein L29 [Gammaproteobacteria bacterium]
MKVEEIRKLSDKDILVEMDKLVRERLSLRVQQVTDQSAKTHQLTNIKKTVARMLTIMNERKRVTHED